MTQHSDYPIIAFTTQMENSRDGQKQVIFSNAYGLEMNVSGDWPVTVLMMTPPHLVEVIEDRIDILRKSMLCGASYTPGDGNYAQISGCGGTWVVARISDNLGAILDAGLGVLLHLDPDVESLSDVLSDPRLDRERLMVSFAPSPNPDIEGTVRRIEAFKQMLAACGLSDVKMLIEGYTEDARLGEYLALADVHGLLMNDCPYHKIVNIIETLYL